MDAIYLDNAATTRLSEKAFEAMKDAVGVDIPQMLRDVTTGGLVGRSAEKAEKCGGFKEKIYLESVDD